MAKRISHARYPTLSPYSVKVPFLLPLHREFRIDIDGISASLECEGEYRNSQSPFRWCPAGRDHLRNEGIQDFHADHRAVDALCIRSQSISSEANRSRGLFSVLPRVRRCSGATSDVPLSMGARALSAPGSRTYRTLDDADRRTDAHLASGDRDGFAERKCESRLVFVGSKSIDLARKIEEIVFATALRFPRAPLRAGGAPLTCLAGVRRSPTSRCGGSSTTRGPTRPPGAMINATTPNLLAWDPSHAAGPGSEGNFEPGVVQVCRTHLDSVAFFSQVRSGNSFHAQWTNCQCRRTRKGSEQFYP